MLECCNAHCDYGWFYLQCMNLATAPSGHWYCSEACKQSTGFTYCICKKKRGAEDDNMVE